MTATTATVPVFIFRTDVSMTAKMAWLELSLESSIKRPDVIIDVKSLAEKLKRSVGTVRRALRELIDAGLVKFKSWVCKRLKVFTLIWHKQARANNAKRDNVGEKKRPVVAQEPKIPGFTEPSPEELGESSFIHNEKGQLCFKANEENEVRAVAYKLVGIGFSQKGAIEIMCKRKLAGCKDLFSEVALRETRGEIIESKVKWFLDRVG